eukprot:14096260-Ditylum_brightwellii.AAC.1
MFIIARLFEDLANEVKMMRTAFKSWCVHSTSKPSARIAVYFISYAMGYGGVSNALGMDGIV